MAFKAFISYSHTADGKLAPAVQEGLRVIAKPWYRLRTMRVFRDQTNLGASPGLWSSILAALEESEFFLFMASPTAARSPWVQKEIEWWLSNRPSERLLILLTEGEMVWNETQQDFDWTQTTALPAQISKAFREEPLYIEMRWARSSDQLSLRHLQFRAAILDLAATLLGRPKDELDGEDVRQFRRTRRVLWSGIAILATLLVAATLAAYVAIQQRDLAVSRVLSAHSDAMLSTSPELALLLAREAMRIKADDEAEAVLRRAIAQSPERYFHAGPAANSITADFAANANFIVASGDDPKAWVWDAHDGRRLAELPATPTDHLALSSSRDGAVVLIQSTPNSFSLYDTRLWKSLTTLPGRRARFSPDGTWLAATAGNEIRCWDFPSLKPRPPISLPRGYTLLDISPDGRFFLAVQTASDAPALLLKTDSGAQTAKLPQSMFLGGPMFSPDGRMILAVSGNPASKFALDLWDVESGKKSLTLKGDPDWPEAASFSPDGKTLVTGSRDGVIHLWDLKSGKYVRNLAGHSNRVRRVEFSRDGALILSLSVDGTSCLWHVESDRCLVRLGGQGDNIGDIRFSPDSLQFLTTHTDGTVRLWTRENWYPVLNLPGDQAAISADGRMALAWNQGRSAQLWDVRSGKLAETLKLPEIEVTTAVSSPDGSAFAFAPEKGAVQLWNAQRKQFLPLGNSSTITTGLAFSPNSKLLLTVDGKGSVQFWNTLDGRLLGQWPGSGTPTTQLLVVPDGSAVLLGSPPQSPQGQAVIQYRDISTGAPLWKINVGTDDYVMAASARTTEGHPLLLVLVNSGAQLWDLAKGAQVKAFTGHHDQVFSGAFSADGRRVATGSGYYMASGSPADDDDEVRVWDVQTGRELVRYRAGSWVQQQVVFGDGATIIAADRQHAVRVYRCNVCLPLPEILKRAATYRDLTAEERSRYIPVESLWGTLLGRNKP